MIPSEELHSSNQKYSSSFEYSKMTKYLNESNSMFLYFLNLVLSCFSLSSIKKRYFILLHSLIMNVMSNKELYYLICFLNDIHILVFRSFQVRSWSPVFCCINGMESQGHLISDSRRCWILLSASYIMNLFFYWLFIFGTSINFFWYYFLLLLFVIIISINKYYQQ